MMEQGPSITEDNSSSGIEAAIQHMSSPSTVTADDSATSSDAAPVRCIYTQADLEQFQSSDAKRDLLGFATALGRSCAAAAAAATTASSSSTTTSKTLNAYRYDPQRPLAGLSPTTASLHGSLRHMAQQWLTELPPDPNARARFGNPTFRTWHVRLVDRSEAIVRCMLECHRTHVLDKAKEKVDEDEDEDGNEKTTSEEGEYSMEILQSCSDAGYDAAAGISADLTSGAASTSARSDKEKRREAVIVQELRAYLHQAFGHPTRLDYGTGHESSFLIVLFCLCKLRCIGDGQSPPEACHLAPVALAIFSQYLEVTRGLQKDYMLEPAGSHGVWGLDDYHCLPFYFGSCQLQALEEEGKKSNGSNAGGGSDGNDEITPRSIHDDALLARLGDTYMYLGCIRYIKELKSSVPFFESSPMLDDISNLPSWGRVSRGLLRLYDGEVLTKLPVIQHFIFGTLFQASWTPSAQPREAPERTFINGPGGDECIAPWAEADGSAGSGASEAGSNAPGLIPPTKAPWAK